MKIEQIAQLSAKLKASGFDKEVPLSILKKELVPIIGCDKYRLKYQIEALVECGYFTWLSVHTLRLNNGDGSDEFKQNEMWVL